MKYTVSSVKPDAYKTDEVMTVRFRYKAPEAAVSREIVEPVVDRYTSFENATGDMRFAAAVAGFGMLLRGSEHAGDAGFEQILMMAREAEGTDREGYRAEFVAMVEAAGAMGQPRALY
jgi:Ca-activated chloride channel family protein